MRTPPRTSPYRRTQPLKVVVAVVTALTVLLGAGLADAASTREELSEVQRSLRKVRGELATARDDAETLAHALADANRTLGAAQRELETAQAAWVTARRRSVAAGEALSRASLKVIEAQKVRDDQARHAYMTGGIMADISVLLEARTLGDLSARAVSVQRVAEAHNQALRRLVAAKRAAELAQQRMEAAERVAARHRVEVERKVAALAEVRAVRAEAKRRLDAKVAELVAREAHLAGRSAKLLAEIRAEEAAARRGAEAEARRRAAIQRRAEAAGAARAGSLRSHGGVCDLSGTSAAERWIILHESGGRPTAQNPHSTAFGLGQLILANRLRYLGRDYATTDCAKQLWAFRRYIADAYGTAEAAKAFWQANGWY